METTLNIRSDILMQITETARIRGITRSEIIIILLKKVMTDTSAPDSLWKMVKYQNRIKTGGWHRFHLNLRPDDYEYFLDLRKLLKMSVSLILSYAVEKYLHKFLRKEFTDNYRYKNYVIIKEYIDTIPCWKLIWGYPPNLGKHI